MSARAMPLLRGEKLIHVSVRAATHLQKKLGCEVLLAIPGEIGQSGRYCLFVTRFNTREVL